VENKTDGIVHIRVKENRDVLNVVMVYNSVYGKDIGEVVTSGLEEWEQRRIIIGGDFNIRIGKLGGEEEEWGTVRSKDKKIGNRGRNFVEAMQKKGMYVLNGKTSGD